LRRAEIEENLVGIRVEAVDATIDQFGDLINIEHAKRETATKPPGITPEQGLRRKRNMQAL
jgi:hypothetical protein